MQRDDVGVTLHQDTLVFFADGLAGLKSAVQHLAFDVDVGFRRVDVLGRFDVFGHDAPGKCDDLAAHAVDGKDDAVAEKIAGGQVATRVGRAAQAEIKKHLLIVAGCNGGGQKLISVLRRISQSEFLNGFLAKAALSEITQPHAAAPVGIQHLILKELQRILVDDVEAVGDPAFLGSFARTFNFFYLNAILFGNVFERFREGEAFQFHQKLHSIAAFATAETLENVARRRYVERGRFFVVKRA